MSSIHEALKKAATDREKTVVQNKMENGTINMGETENNVKNIENMKVLFLLIAVIVVFSVGIVRVALANKWISFSKKPVIVTRVTKPPIPDEKIIKEPYVLNGVIEDGANSMAIINGKVLKLNDKIDSWQVKNISTREVSLANSLDEQNMVLKIK